MRFPDKVHPDAKGAEGMAYLIHNAITAPAGSRNTATVPAVNPGPALWGGYDWLARHQADCELAKRGEAQLICIGDSITHGFGGEPHLDQGAGEPVWRERLERWKPINMGFSGDKTEHVLWRLAHGAVDGAKPKAVMVMIGTNNLQSNTPDEIVEGVRAILRALREKLPDARVLLLAIFPRARDRMICCVSRPARSIAAWHGSATAARWSSRTSVPSSLNDPACCRARSCPTSCTRMKEVTACGRMRSCRCWRR